MPTLEFVSKDRIRANFAKAMSVMYKEEVPLYGDLLSLVDRTNNAYLAERPEVVEELKASGGLERVSVERHGAVRVGTAEELRHLKRIFAAMGMYPVGYYDLSAAAVPVHSTAFRPIDPTALAANPFRVFTSLLRLDLIKDHKLRQEAERALAKRKIMSGALTTILDQIELDGGLKPTDLEAFIREAVQVFKWHAEATIDLATYSKLSSEHRLIADVVSFKGPHINHLTPRALDIDAAQEAMVSSGIEAKEVIEGPPRRHVPILLRQTSFKALEEAIQFPNGGKVEQGTHSARFGEIEARGIALTRKGRKLYDVLLQVALKAKSEARARGKNPEKAFSDAFVAFPDDLEEIRQQELAFFEYEVASQELLQGAFDKPLNDLLAQGIIQARPIIYEDFLPVSAAGIFQSNLDDSGSDDNLPQSNQADFEAALGCKTQDEFELYEAREIVSIERCMLALTEAKSVA